MNSSDEGRLEQAVEGLLKASVAPGAVSREEARLLVLKAVTLKKPVFPSYRVAAVLTGWVLAGLLVFSNPDWLSWLALSPLESLPRLVAAMNLEQLAAALSVAGGVSYTVYSVFCSPSS